MKIFLDVGAHIGQILPAALDPRFGFDRIVCFEPAPSCWPRLRRFRDSRILLCRFGLAARSQDVHLYSPGTPRGSVFSEARTAGADSEVVQMVRASDWFRRSIGRGDEVYAKLNVEGSECDILDDLMDTGEIHKVRSMLVDFDVRRFLSQRHRESETKDRLAAEGVTGVVDSRDVRGETIVARVRAWLTAAGAEQRSLGLADRARSGVVALRYERLPRVIRTSGLPRLGHRILPPAAYRRIRSALLANPFQPRSPR